MNFSMSSRAKAHRVILLMLTIAFISAAASGAHAQGGGSRAGLIIRFEDGSVQTRCITFSEPGINGLDLLRRSGLTVAVDYMAGLGGAVCSIDGHGCPVTDCFCRCQGPQCEYWGYYQWLEGSWQYSQTGAKVHQVTDGALEGWAWGAGDFMSGAQPPEIAFADICPVITPTPTSIPVSPPASIPEPTTLLLFGSGLAALAAYAHGRKAR